MGYGGKDRVIHDDIDKDTGTEQADSLSCGSGVGAKHSHSTTSTDSKWHRSVTIHTVGAKHSHSTTSTDSK
jgi:hypothetical protein